MRLNTVDVEMIEVEAHKDSEKTDNPNNNYFNNESKMNNTTKVVISEL